MRSLIALLVKYGGFLSFILLELICLFIIVQYNKNQKDIFLHSSSLISGRIYDAYDNVVSYYSLNRVIDSLAIENAELRSLLFLSRFSDLSVPDTIYDANRTEHYRLIPARVRNNSITAPNNNLTLNKGDRDGISKDMGVITGRGIVGIVRSTSENFSRAISLLNRQTRISASILHKDYFGIIRWRSSDPRYVALEDIPKYADPEVGDTVVTSGYSAIFPPGLLIGTVKESSLRAGSNTYSILVELTEDMATIDQVYVVDYTLKEELESIEDDAE